MMLARSHPNSGYRRLPSIANSSISIAIAGDAAFAAALGAVAEMRRLAALCRQSRLRSSEKPLSCCGVSCMSRAAIVMPCSSVWLHDVGEAAGAHASAALARRHGPDSIFAVSPIGMRYRHCKSPRTRLM